MSDPLIDQFRNNMDGNIQELLDNLSSLEDGSDRAFAQSLCDFYRNKGYLSNKQLFWAAKFHNDTVGSSKGNKEDQYEKLPVRHKHPEAAPRCSVDGRQLIAYFDNASKKLQKPKVSYPVSPPLYGTDMLLFYRCGAGSHAPNAVGVTNGLSYPNNRILAIMYRDGRTVFFSFTFDKPELQQLIKRVAENPLASFSAKGKETSNCCFCNLTLSHPSSLFYGYGPICAANWHLPWGEVELATQELQLPINLGQEN